MKTKRELVQYYEVVDPAGQRHAEVGNPTTGAAGDATARKWWYAQVSSLGLKLR
jgi:hypothetical protein